MPMTVAGKVSDFPPPSPIGIECAHVLIPQSWLDENEENRKTILENAVNRATPY